MTADTCRCGHPKAQHTRAEGPNSNNRYLWDLCANGWELFGGYYYPHPVSCGCRGLRLRWWWPWRRDDR
jgi:hypothetical protein